MIEWNRPKDEAMHVPRGMIGVVVIQTPGVVINSRPVMHKQILEDCLIGALDCQTEDLVRLERTIC